MFMDKNNFTIVLTRKPEQLDEVVVTKASFNSKGLFSQEVADEIKLEKGINKIDFEALNEGFAPPNTAEFQVYDDKGSIISASQWNLGIDYKATLLLMKE